MTVKTAADLLRLEQQAKLIDEVFAAAGCETIQPDILQPADLFLDRSGENIRQRAYMFSDLDGAELCLRPDLTVPVCRVYLALHPDGDHTVRYAYRGPAFRFQPIEQPGSAREFEQMGVEFFGDSDRQAVEAEVLALALRAVRASGLHDFRIRFGDLGLFSALAGGIPMPERWRLSMQHMFWRPAAFRDLLARLSGSADKAGPAGRVLDSFAQATGATPKDRLYAVLEQHDIPLVGVRSADEIAARLEEQVKDLNEPPLAMEVVRAIEDYLAISGTPGACLAKIREIAAALGVDMSEAIDGFERRLELLRGHGIALQDALFSAEFGRTLEYYTGFVFQIERPDLGVAGQIAGGGRYDDLMMDLGAPGLVPAMGCAIHTERLARAVSEPAP